MICSQKKMLKSILMSLGFVALVALSFVFFFSPPLQSVFAEETLPASVEYNFDDAPALVEGVNYVSESYHGKTANMFLALVEKGTGNVKEFARAGEVLFVDTNEYDLFLCFGLKLQNDTLNSTAIVRSLEGTLSVETDIPLVISKSIVDGKDGFFINQKIDVSTKSRKLDLNLSFKLDDGSSVSESREISFSCYIFDQKIYQTHSSANVAYVSESYHGKTANMFLALVEKATGNVKEFARADEALFVDTNEYELFLCFGLKLQNNTLNSTAIVRSLEGTLSVETDIPLDLLKSTVDGKDGFVINQKIDVSTKSGKLDLNLRFNLDDGNSGVSERREISFSCYIFDQKIYQSTHSSANVVYENYQSIINNVSQDTSRIVYANYQTQELASLAFDPHKFDLHISRTFASVQFDYQITHSNNKMTITALGNAYPDLWFDDSNPNRFVIYFKDLGVYQINYTYKYDGLPLDNINNSEINRSDEIYIFGFQANYSSQKIELRSQQNVANRADVTYQYIGTNDIPDILPDILDIPDILDAASSFVSTNLGPVSFVSNAKKSDGVVLYKLINGELKKQDTFPDVISETGTYFAVINYTYDRYKTKTTTINPAQDQKFVQYFAFTISSNNPTLSVEEDVEAGKSIYSGSYTNKDVKISSPKLGEFDSDVQVTIWRADFAQNPNNVVFDDANPLLVHSLGDQALDFVYSANGKYKITIRYGHGLKSSTTSYFYIDKEEISGHGATHLMQNIIDGSYEKSEPFEEGRILTNESFAVLWNEKLSGAKITTYYSFVPLILQQVGEYGIYEEGGYCYIDNGYALDFSQQVKGILAENTKDIRVIAGSNLFSTPGLYIFSCEDEASNSASWSVFLDNSPITVLQKAENEDNYYHVDGVNVVGADTTVLWGTHKAIKLLAATGTEEEVYENVYAEQYKEYFKHIEIEGENPHRYFFLNPITRVIRSDSAQKEQTQNEKFDNISPLVSDDNGNVVENLCDYEYYLFDSANKKSQNQDCTTRFVIRTSTDQTATTPTINNSQLGFIEDEIKEVDGQKVKHQYYRVSSNNISLQFKDISNEVITNVEYTIEFYEQYYDKSQKSLTYQAVPTQTDLADYNITSDGKTVVVNLFYNSDKVENGKFVITRTYKIAEGKEGSFAETHDYKTRVLHVFVDANDVMTYESELISAEGTGDDGKTTVAEYAKKVGEFVKLQVKDGSTENLPPVFDQFYRQNQQNLVFVEGVPTKNSLGEAIITTNYMPNSLYVPFYKFGTVRTFEVEENTTETKFVGEELCKIAGGNLHTDFNLKIDCWVWLKDEQGKDVWKKLNITSQTKDNYLKLSFNKDELNEYANTMSEHGLYFAIKISDGVAEDISKTNSKTNEWWFAFEIQTRPPQVDITAITNPEGGYKHEKELQADDGTYYTNADNLELSWQDSPSPYMAKIQSITFNGNDVYSYDDSLPNHTISCPTSGQLQSGTINVTLQGNSGDYFSGTYKTSYKINVNRTAPTDLLEEVLSVDIMLDSNQQNSVRQTGNGYNITTKTGMFKNYAFAYSLDELSTDNDLFVREIINYGSRFISAVLPFEPSVGSSPSNLFLPDENLDHKFDNTNGYDSGYYEVFEVDKWGNITYFVVYHQSDDDKIVQTINNTNIDDNDHFIIQTSSFSINQISMGLAQTPDYWYSLSITELINSTDVNLSKKTYYSTANNKTGWLFNKNGEETLLQNVYEFRSGYKYKIEITNRLENKTISIYISMYNSLGFVNPKVDYSSNTIYVDEILSKNLSLCDGFISNVDIIPVSAADVVVDDFKFSGRQLGIECSGLTTKLSRFFLSLTAKTFDGNDDVNNGEPDDVTFYVELFSLADDTFTFDCNDLQAFEEGEDRINYASTDVRLDWGESYYVSAEKIVGAVTETVSIKNNSSHTFASLKTENQSTTGGIVRYVITITLDVDLDGSDDENLKKAVNSYKKVYVFEIDNRMPKIVASSNNGDDKSYLLNSSFYTSEGLYVSYSFDGISKNDFVITYYKDGEFVGDLLSNTFIKEDGKYEFVVAFTNPKFSHTTNYVLSIKDAGKAAYTVVGKIEQGDVDFEEIELNEQYYQHNNEFYPLYITNYPHISVNTDENLAIKNPDLSKIIVESKDEYSVYVFHLTNAGADGVSRYIDEKIAVMQFNKTENLDVGFAYLDRNSVSTPFENTTSNIYISKDDVSSGFDKLTVELASYYITPYNRIKLLIRLGNQIVVGNENGGIVLGNEYIKNDIYNFKLTENGEYQITISDEAGNIHHFGYQNSKASEYRLGFFKSVPFFVNGLVPVNYAVYNNDSPVEISLDQVIKYDESGKPQISVLLNGKETSVGFDGQKWTIQEPGFYQIKFVGATKTLVGAESQDKVLFDSPVHYLTIIDSNDARLAFNWSKYDDYKITSIKRNGEELCIDQQGNQIFKDDYYLSVFAGDQTGRYEITISPHSKDSVLVLAPFTFSFNLRTAQAPIIVNIPQGETTKDKITVTYNPKNVYDLLGNCKLIIVDNNGSSNEYAINSENCADESTTQTITKAGTYHIKIYNNSGNLLYSYKVSKKDPLNTIAIVVIVVGCVAVAVLTFLFIKLRKKVKIK